MRVEIKAKTPKNQAEKCKVQLENNIMGLWRKKGISIVRDKIVAHNELLWVVEYSKPEHIEDITRRAAIAEVKIKEFYKQLIHLIHRADKICRKCRKGYRVLRSIILKKIRKQIPDPVKRKEFETYIDSMTDEELLKINDEEEITNLISNPIITVKNIDLSQDD